MKASFLAISLAAMGYCGGLAAVAAVAGCNEGALKQTPDGGVAVHGLTAEQSNRVLARIGERTITVADFAKTLDRMDPYDRLRYQSKERRRDLLNEMVDVELLALEAKRRGLDKQPETEEQVDQVLRDAVLADARKTVPSPGDIPAEEVRAYYDAHQEKFTEPERRRVAAIVLDDPKKAAEVLKLALKTKTLAEWSQLFAKHSLTAPKAKDATPAELTGDLGIVGPPDDPRGASAHVPDSVRAAAFAIGAKDEVLDHLVTTEGKSFIVRLNGVTEAHKRSLAQADRSIRILLLQDKLADKDKAIEDELKKKIPIEIDDKALATVVVPPIPPPPPSEKGDSDGADAP